MAYGSFVFSSSLVNKNSSFKGWGAFFGYIQELPKNKSFVTFAVDDSLNFLSKFKKKIDFLYLDSLDGQHKNSSQHQLDEIMIAKKHLVNNSLILLDDKGEKTNLSIDYMLKNNFKIINETDEQVLLSY